MQPYGLSWQCTCTTFRSFAPGHSKLLTCPALRYRLSLFLRSLSYHCAPPPFSACDISALRGVPHPPNPTRQSRGEPSPSLPPMDCDQTLPPTPPLAVHRQVASPLDTLAVFQVLSQNNQSYCLHRPLEQTRDDQQLH